MVFVTSASIVADTLTLPPALTLFTEEPLIVALTLSLIVLVTSDAATETAPRLADNATPIAADLVTVLPPVETTSMLPTAPTVESLTCASILFAIMLFEPTPAAATAPPTPIAIATDPAKAVASTVSVALALTVTFPFAFTTERSMEASTWLARPAVSSEDL